ncbi:branched-chain amino acid aminotransferase [Desulfohalotomaculum tongense]|uniref:branched-chain amino acid aminotransferase n=1 Tax=Desulforadius tongensis TaxID=1216062 RepID=UPI00195E2B27|nr:branched-chain amino acid aminotransferase [Desulforadius tongensis]MBM7853965.1 branched-chain amino acid aminotransferase [Desulforadius tongensis]
MKIYLEPIPERELKPLFEDAGKLIFGRIFTDRMFTMKYNAEKGWHDAKIEKYKSFSLDPAACVLHYSQEIFEGLKAYVSEDGRVLMFRPEENVRRMNRSARRLCMPEIPEEDFLQAMKELIMTEKRWIPRAPGTSLYVRPTMLGTEAFLGVHPAAEYLFYIILSPVGPYFKDGFNPVSIYVEDTLVRAVVGGVGDIKTGGNYAASLMAGLKAKEKGFSQVLWLDAKEHKYVEEVGAMNIFFVYGDQLVTPSLSGSILPGITRASVLELAADMGYRVEERAIAIDEVLEEISSGRITEVFGSGTAAVVSPVGSLHYKGQNYVVNNNQVGEVTKAIYTRLIDIQYGKAEDKFGWVCELGRI